MIRVVLAEDQAMVRGAFAVLLSLEPDIEVVAVVEDGEQGLAAVAEHQPDIVLTDIEMPGMTGLELASRLKADPTVRVVGPAAIVRFTFVGEQEFTDGKKTPQPISLA